MSSSSSSSTKSNVAATIDATLEQLGLSRADIDSLVSASQEELKPYLDKAKVRAKDDTKKVEDMLAPYANKAQDYANKITEAAKQAAETTRKVITEGYDGSREEFEAAAADNIKKCINMIKKIIASPIKIISVPLTAVKNIIGGLLGGGDDKKDAKKTTEAQTEKELKLTFAKLDSALKKNLGMDLGTYVNLRNSKVL
eukprot:CAMPEP_0198716548 /NCGR_PEP_ID=MMETSP1471-20131121/38808_1 /TAXON_ID=41880 /ORGANISM="Pycnococcus provasolii, Strain RCC733" /LENGTH=197 /DNA_ID=CAMNT_0044477077 /DNA_START=29 /DNA_END=622 /DNA_ORIENTATION=-